MRHKIGNHAELPSRGEIGAWWGSSTEHTTNGLRTIQREAEVVVREGGAVELVGEAKWADRDIGTAALSQLRATVAAIPGSSPDTRLVLFAREGFNERLREIAAAEGVLLVTAADMFDG